MEPTTCPQNFYFHTDSGDSLEKLHQALASDRATPRDILDILNSGVTPTLESFKIALSHRQMPCVIEKMLEKRLFELTDDLLQIALSTKDQTPGVIFALLKNGLIPTTDDLITALSNGKSLFVLRGLVESGAVPDDRCIASARKQKHSESVVNFLSEAIPLENSLRTNLVAKEVFDKESYAESHIGKGLEERLKQCARPISVDRDPQQLVNAVKDSNCREKIKQYFADGGKPTLEAFHLALELKRDIKTLTILLHPEINPTHETLYKALMEAAAPMLVDDLMRTGCIKATTRELNEALSRKILPVTIFLILESGAKADDTSLQLAVDYDYSEEVIEKLCLNLSAEEGVMAMKMPVKHPDEGEFNP